MPNITFEYSANINGIDFATLASQIHQLLVDTCQAKMYGCKSRINRIENFVIGDGLDQQLGFISINVSLLAGRSATQKRAFAEQAFALLDTAISNCAQLEAMTCQRRIRLDDMAHDDYFFEAR